MVLDVHVGHGVFHPAAASFFSKSAFGRGMSSLTSQIEETSEKRGSRITSIVARLPRKVFWIHALEEQPDEQTHIICECIYGFGAQKKNKKNKSKKGRTQHECPQFGVKEPRRAELVFAEY